MTKEQKNEVIEVLKGKFSQYNNFYVAETESLTVAQVGKLRRACFSKQVEMKVAKNTLINSILAMDAQEKNMELAQRVFNTVKTKYANGVGSSIETLQADTDLQQAQSNYFRALYDAVLAKIVYMRSLGRL